MKNTSIFYVNSAGFLCQWKGRVTETTDASVIVRFSKSRAYRYQLKSLDCPLFIETKTLVAKTGLAVDQAAESVSFDETVTERLLEILGDNIAKIWKDGKWSNQ